MTSLDKISIPKLKGSDNYITWSIRTKATLTKEDLAAPIEEADLGAKNNKALAIIKLLCEDGPLLYIKDLVSAKEAWSKLKDLYNPSGFTTEYLTLKEFFNNSLDDFSAMEEYLNRVKSLVDDLKGKDIVLPNQVVIAWVLNSLGAEYEGFISNIIQSLRKDPKSYTIETLFSSLIDEARGREANGQRLLATNKAKAYKKANKGSFCQHCKLPSHQTSSCWFLFPDKAPKSFKIRKNKSPDKKMTHQTNGHSLSSQPKKDALIAALTELDSESSESKEKPDEDHNDIEMIHTIDQGLDLFDQFIDYKEDDNLFGIDQEVCLPIHNPNNNEAANNSKLDYLVNKPYSLGQNVNFIVDSAATINTVCNLKYFANYKEINKQVNWGKAKSLKVKYQGDLYIKYRSGYVHTIHNAYCIPELGINLLSIHKMPNISVLFDKEKAILTINQNSIAIASKANNGLYNLSATILYPKDNIYLSLGDKIPISDLQKWHMRLGHINIIPLKLLLSSIGVKISKEDLQNFLDNQCEICLLSKDKRHINKKGTNNHDYEILERIHSDLGGPLPSTYDQYKYYITFLDKKSRYLWVSLLKHKDQTYHAFQKLKAMVENNKSNKRIRELFTDNGGEYINKQFKVLLNEYGIIHYTVPAYTKEPNGLIERINLTLLNKARSLLFNSNAPIYLWGEAIMASVYLYNRTPHKSIQYMTPYELYYNRKPDITNIRIWGSVSYYNTNIQKSKLSPRQEKAILIGYSDHNHYRLWDFQNHKPIWSRDVTILEGKFLRPKGINSDGMDIPQDQDILKENKSRNQSDSMTNEQRPNTRSYQRLISAMPNHRVEVQIPQTKYHNINNHTLPDVEEDNRALYTISDTILKDYISSLDKRKTVAEFLLTTSTNDEPNTLQEALNSPEKDEWIRACHAEIAELERQNTYDIVDIPNNIQPIRGRWVFKKKPIRDPNSIQKGHITNSDQTIRYKARWVIQGFRQILGIDFLETFSTTCRTETWHMILIIAVNKGWHIIQYDVKNAFVHADIDSNIYTILPTGVYDDKSPKYRNKACYLRKALYGLKQAPRLWYKYLTKALHKLGFHVFPYDEGVFINKTAACIIICHVDDILIIHQDLAYIKEISNKAQEYIKIEEIGSVSTFLGNDISINYQTKTLSINQENYITKLLTKFSIYNNNNYKPVQIPGDPGVKLKKNTSQASDHDINIYQKQIGSLLYLALKTRPDITFAVNNCARYMSNPNKDHFNALNKIWKYLLFYPKLGLIYNCQGDNLILKGYCDSDWGNDLDLRRSTSGYLFSLSSDIGINNPLSWNSQLQKTIALSSCEAEYMALKEATKEAIYLHNTFEYLNINLNLLYQPTIPKILVDSSSAKKLAENPEFHKRSKHIDILYHFTRQAIADRKMEVIQIPSKYQLADILTKNVSNLLHKSYIQMASLGNKL